MLDVLDDDEDFWSSVNEDGPFLVHPVTWTDLEHDYQGLLENFSIDDPNSTLWTNWSSSEGVASSPTSHYSTWQIALFSTLAGVTSLVTIAGNLIVILSFIVERTIRQPTNYFIASLAVSDLLIGSISMPFYTVYLLAGQHWPLGEILCDLWLSVDYTVCLCSIYTVFCITIDRFCSVKIPARYREWRTENKVLAMVAVTWAIPVLVFFTSIFGWQYFVGQRTVPAGKCYVQYMEAALFNCLLQVGYFWITLAIMCALYSGIYQVVLNLSRKADEKKKKLTTMVNMVGSALKMRTTVEEDGGQEGRGGGEEERGQNHRNEEDDSVASDDLEMTRRQTDRKRLSSNTGSESDPNQSPLPPRRRKKGGKGSNGQGRNHASGGGKGRTGRALFFGQRKKNGGMKTVGEGGGGGGRETSLRQAIVVSGVKEGTPRPTDICLVLPDSDTSEQRNDPLGSSQDVDRTDKDGQGNQGSLSTGTPMTNYTASPSATMTLQVPGQSPHGHQREGFTQQRSLSATTLDLLTVRPTVSRKSSGVSISSRRCSRSSSVIGPVSFRRWSAGRTPQPTKQHRSSPNSSENRARKALRTITVILGAFVLCWTPWHVLSMIISFCPEDKVCVEPLLYDISYWLCYLNSPINPLCYALANQQFKKTFIRIIKLDFHRT